MAVADEPQAQPAPAFAPAIQALLQRVGLFVNVARRGVARLAISRLPQQRFDSWRKCNDALRDCTGATDQVADKAFQIIDQALLVGQHRLDVGLLQLDRARHAGHERLRIIGQSFEHAYQVAQHFMHLGGVRHRFIDQRQQGFEPIENILERNRLQFSATLQCLRKCRQRCFDRLAADR